MKPIRPFLRHAACTYSIGTTDGTTKNTLHTMSSHIHYMILPVAGCILAYYPVLPGLWLPQATQQPNDSTSKITTARLFS